MARSTRLPVRPRALYAAGLIVVLGVRLIEPPEPVQVGVVSLALAAMVLTYVVDTEATASPMALIVGLAGIVAGSALALSGRLAGVAFLAGGLLFVNLAGERS